MKRIYVLLSLLCLLTGRSFATAALFENSTEESTDGWTHVTPAFASALMKREAKLQDLSEYAKDGDIPKDPSTRLVWRPVPLSIDGKRFWYVRPTLEPFFTPFYGAHQFQHWLVGDGHVIYEESSDAFKVLSSHHNGMRDIEEVACSAVECSSTQLRFDRRSGRYKPASCRVHVISDGKDIGPCGHAGQ
jgi:hypothetical protein